MLNKSAGKTALTFGGFDPCGGAGILADVRTFEYLGLRGAAILTAITVQGPESFIRAQGGMSDLIIDMAATLAKQIDVTAIKIGMLYDASTVRAVCRALDFFPKCPVVVDPVLFAGKGGQLLDSQGVSALKDLVLPQATLLTPNIPETKILTGITVADSQSAMEAGKIILAMGAEAVLIKGGHSEKEAIDFLVTENHIESLNARRIDSVDLHGTGCALSSAVAAMLGKGQLLSESVASAKDYVYALIAKAATDIECVGKCSK